MTEAPTLVGPDLKRDQLVARLRTLRPAFEKEGVTSMALIGSRARGDNRPDSDIDLMIEVDPGRKFSILDLIAVKHIIEDHVGLSTDVIMRRSLKPDFRANAERDAVDVY
jgi:predicted nucleotidyltransferase